MTDSTAFFGLKSERGLLRLSVAVGLTVALLGIGFGLGSGSFSVLFDGVHSLVDVSMSLLSLLVVNLIMSDAVTRSLSPRLRERFSLGFWHLEPMVLGLNGVLLMSVAIYALFNAGRSLFEGGRELEFGMAIVYAICTILICGSIALVEARANRTIKSDFIRLDVSGWIMSTGITAALLVAFIIGYALENTEWTWLTPYIDPATLALVCLFIIPIPIKTVRRALADMLLVTPEDLRQHVETVAAALVERHGLVAYRAYTARVGRSKIIELYFVVRPDDERTIADWDALRQEVGAALGPAGPHRWLTIVFTGDPVWTE